MEEKWCVLGFPSPGRSLLTQSILLSLSIPCFSTQLVYCNMTLVIDWVDWGVTKLKSDLIVSQVSEHFSNCNAGASSSNKISKNARASTISSLLGNQIPTSPTNYFDVGTIMEPIKSSRVAKIARKRMSPSNPSIAVLTLCLTTSSRVL